MKHSEVLKSIILVLAILTSVGLYAQTFQVGAQRESAIQSHQMMNSGATYSGTVYEPFTPTTPADQSYSPAQLPGGPRRGYDANGNWTPDAGDLEHAGDYGQSNLSPVGEPWVMIFFALAFAGFIAYRRTRKA